MLGLGKKKKKEDADASEKPGSSERDKPESREKQKDQGKPEAQDAPVKNKSKKKKRFSIKKILLILLVLAAVGVSSAVVYILYLAPEGPNGSQYKTIQLDHIHLPEEMVRFTYDYFPDLYAAMISFNKEMNLIDKKIADIDSVTQKYPDQKKITDKEKKSWENEKTRLQKPFLTVEKSVKEIYVLFAVNKELGLAEIESKAEQLAELAKNALIAAQERTRTLKIDDEVPEGFIRGNIYKLKKKFL